MVSGRDLSQLSLSQVDGFKEIPQTLVSRLVQHRWVNLCVCGECGECVVCVVVPYLQNAGLEKLGLSFQLHVRHSNVEPLEPQLCVCVGVSV